MEALAPLALVALMFLGPMVWMYMRRNSAEAAMREAAEALGGRTAEIERKGFFDVGLEIKAEVEGRRVKVGLRLSKKRCSAKVKISKGPEEILRLVSSKTIEGKALQLMYQNVPNQNPADFDGVLLQPIDNQKAITFIGEQTEMLALFRELRPAHMTYMIEDMDSDRNNPGSLVTSGNLEVMLSEGFTDADRFVKLARLTYLGACMTEDLAGR